MYFILDNLVTKAKVPSPPPRKANQGTCELFKKGLFSSFSLEQIF
jgi:hypothetical protein